MSTINKKNYSHLFTRQIHIHLLSVNDNARIFSHMRKSWHIGLNGLSIAPRKKFWFIDLQINSTSFW